MSLNPEQTESILLESAREAIRATLDEARQMRERIEATDAIDLREAEAKAAALAGVERRLHALKVVGDLIVGAALEEAAGVGQARMIVEAAAEEIREALGGVGRRPPRCAPYARRGARQRRSHGGSGAARARPAAAIPLGT